MKKILLLIFLVNFKILFSDTSFDIEQAIIGHRPQKLIHILKSVDGLSVDEKAYYQVMARQMAVKINAKVCQEDLNLGRLFPGLIYFIIGSSFSVYSFSNYRGLKDNLNTNNTDIKTLEKAEIISGILVMFLGIKKFCDGLVKADIRQQRISAFAIEAILERTPVIID